MRRQAGRETDDTPTQTQTARPGRRQIRAKPDLPRTWGLPISPYPLADKTQQAHHGLRMFAVSGPDSPRFPNSPSAVGFTSARSGASPPIHPPTEVLSVRSMACQAPEEEHCSPGGGAQWNAGKDIDPDWLRLGVMAFGFGFESVSVQRRSRPEREHQHLTNDGHPGPIFFGGGQKHRPTLGCDAVAICGGIGPRSAGAMPAERGGAMGRGPRSHSSPPRRRSDLKGASGGAARGVGAAPTFPVGTLGSRPRLCGKNRPRPLLRS